MEMKMRPRNGETIDIHPLKEQLRKKLPPDSLVLMDLLREPDSMPVGSAEILIPHYLRRLEGELERHETSRQLVLRP
jgi:hypothetical protein